MQDRIAYTGITFDDVLLEPGYSDVVPRDTDVRTQLTRNVRINIPVVSSPMDTVTESELAIALGITPAHAQAVYDDIRNKRRTTKYLHMAPVLAGDVPELD